MSWLVNQHPPDIPPQKQGLIHRWFPLINKALWNGYDGGGGLGWPAIIVVVQLYSSKGLWLIHPFDGAVLQKKL